MIIDLCKSASLWQDCRPYDVSKTKAMPHNEDTESWTFEHCWNILRHEPKWNDKMIEIGTVGTGTRVNQRVHVDAAAEPMLGENADNTARPEGRSSEHEPKLILGHPCHSS